MTPSPEIQDRAKAYVDRVLDSQRRLGHPSRVPEDEYHNAIMRAAQGAAALSGRVQRPETP